MKTNGIIYLHKNKVNGKCYIGQTFQKPNERWKNGKGYYNQPKFYNAILKYGWNNFEHIILEQNLSEDIIDERERYWINYYNCLGENGYNIKYDNKTLHIFSEEHKKNLKKGIRRSTGKSIICLNNKKIYECITDAEKELKIHHIGDCCKKKIKSAGQDENGYALVWRYLDEYDENEIIVFKKQSQIKKVMCIETNEIFNNCTEAGKAKKCDNTSIGRCCKGIRKSAGRYQWKYV